jgi:hypothetical protein
VKMIKSVLLCASMIFTVTYTAIAAQAEVETLTEQDMRMVHGAGTSYSACTYERSCQAPCTANADGTFRRLAPVPYLTCHESLNPLATCPNVNYPNKPRKCGNWRQHGSRQPDGTCSGWSQAAGFQCIDEGCSGTVCPPGTPGYIPPGN